MKAQARALFDWLPIQLPQKFKIRDAAALGIPAHELELSCGSDLKLIVSMQAERAREPKAEGTPGSESRGISLDVQTRQYEEGVLHGLRPQTWTRTIESGAEKTHLNGMADTLAITFYEGAAVAVCEWLTNVPSRLWTRCTERQQTTTSQRRRGHNAVEARDVGEDLSRDYSEITLGLPTLACIQVGSVTPARVTEGLQIQRPGFIEFRTGPNGSPDEGLRRTVRRAFEFLFGCGFGVLGHSELDQGGRPLRAVASSAYVPGGFGPALPPAILSPTGFDLLDEELVKAFVTRYIELEEHYDLNRAVWLYLHARCAPLDMAAGYLGGAFEILRRGFYALPENGERSRLLPNPQWRVLARELRTAVDRVSGRPEWNDYADALASLKKGLGTLNQISGSRLNAQFLVDLGLGFGETEQGALQARNESAHANRLDAAEHFAALRAYRALHVLFARSLFAALGVEVRYLDYSSLGFPARPLRERQGEHGTGDPRSK